MDEQIGLMLVDITKIKKTELYLRGKVNGLLKFTNKMSYKPTNVPRKFIWRVEAIEKRVKKLQATEAWMRQRVVAFGKLNYKIGRLPAAVMKLKMKMKAAELKIKQTAFS